MAEKVLIGIVGNHYGYEGEFNFILEYKAINFLPKGFRIYIGYSPNFANEYIIEKFEKKNNRVIAKLQGINSKEEVEKLQERGIFASELEIKKYNEQFIPTDNIIGCEVIDNLNGQKIGKIIEVWELPANDVWLVETDFGELPLPVINDVIVETNFENKIVKINVIDGLLDLTHGRGVVDED